MKEEKKLTYYDFIIIKTALKEKSEKLIENIEKLAEYEELENGLNIAMNQLKEISILIEKLEKK